MNKTNAAAWSLAARKSSILPVGNKSQGFPRHPAVLGSQGCKVLEESWNSSVKNRSLSYNQYFSFNFSKFKCRILLRFNIKIYNLKCMYRIQQNNGILWEHFYQILSLIVSIYIVKHRVAYIKIIIIMALVNWNIEFAFGMLIFSASDLNIHFNILYMGLCEPLLWLSSKLEWFIHFYLCILMILCTLLNSQSGPFASWFLYNVSTNKR